MSSRAEAKGATRRAVLLPAAAVAAGALPLPALAQGRNSGTTRQPAGRVPAAPPPGSPATTPLGPVDTVARQALVIDFDTEAVLLEKNPDERMPPSSMSKLMTMYVVFDMLKQGRISEVADVANNDLVRRIGEQRVTVKAQLALESRTLLPGHPRIKELKAEIADLEGELRSAADKTAG